MIERYIDRTITPSEEKEFLLLLDRDPELRRMLDAEQVVRTALLHDRDALPTTNAESRAQFIAFIGTALQKSGELAAPALAASHGATIFSAGAIKATLAALITCALITGIYLFSSSSFFASSFASSASLRAPSPRSTAKPTAPSSIPAAPSPVAATPEPPIVGARAPKNHTTSAHTPLPSQMESPRVDTAHDSPAANPPFAPEVSNPPQTISSDRMRLNVKLNLEKLNRE